MSYAFEPAAPWTHYLGSGTSWEQLDDELSARLGRPAIALPSVRTGIYWLLQHLGLSRHTDELLVPRYVGRCILNTVGLGAHPALTPGPKTRLAMLVHWFGRDPDWQAVRPELERRGLRFFEDAPDGLAAREEPAEGSLGKFIALSKLLPLVKGGAFITDDAAVADALRRRRAGRGPAWAPWLALATLLPCRRGVRLRGNAFALEAAYALYPCCPADNGALRRGFRASLSLITSYAELEGRRTDALLKACGAAGLAPQARRLVHAVPIRASDAAASALRHAGFSDEAFHIDVAANMFAPRFERFHLVPVHPSVPAAGFEALLAGLREARVGV